MDFILHYVEEIGDRSTERTHMIKEATDRMDATSKANEFLDESPRDPRQLPTTKRFSRLELIDS